MHTVRINDAVWKQLSWQAVANKRSATNQLSVILEKALNVSVDITEVAQEPDWSKMTPDDVDAEYRRRGLMK